MHSLNSFRNEISNLCDQFHDVIIIPFFLLTPEILKCWTRMRKNTKIRILHEPKERFS